MTSRPGGEADKTGNRYECYWAVNSLLDVLQGRAERVVLEPVGPEGEGVEFWVERDGKREYHQAKREAGHTKRWTLARLGTEGVLATVKARLCDPDRQFVFVSGSSADELQTLATRALAPVSAIDYREHSLSQQQGNDFDSLRDSYWGGCSEDEAFHLLKRLRVECRPEDALRDDILNRISPILEGDEETAYAVLAHLIQERVDKEKVLTADVVWRYLKQRRIGRTDWWNDKDQLARFEEATARYKCRIEGEAIMGAAIPRPEAAEIAAVLTDPAGKRIVLAEGEAGTGKSGVLLQVLEDVMARAWPVLAFRLDTLDQVHRPEEIGRCITGMEKSPARILAAVAQDRECLLVIDQLDAVSLVSGRHAGNYEVVEEILQQVASYPNMRVVLACRRFDAQNDQRLRKLRSTDTVALIGIGVLSDEVVRDVVGKLGYKQSFTQGQLRLLAIPLHLRLLEQIAAGSTDRNLGFQTNMDLFDEFWKSKQRKVAEHAADHFVDVLDALLGHMSENQTLTAPEDSVDRWRQCADAMVSEHVVILAESGGYSFFHEGFFDYASARRFAARGKDLPTMLKSSEQHLFRRAQVRQILLYERKTRWYDYIRDVNALLTDPEVREHIKEVVLGVLSGLPDPTKEEWAAINKLPTSSAGLASQGLWRVIANSAPWFNLLDGLGVMEKWLSQEDEHALWPTLTMVGKAQPSVPDRASELLRPFSADIARHRGHLFHVLVFSDLDASEGFLQFFDELVGLGLYDENPPHGDFWHYISRVAEKNPTGACGVIATYFEWLRRSAAAGGKSHPFATEDGIIHEDHAATDVLTRCASQSPHALVQWALPLVLRISRATVIDEGSPPLRDSLWGFRSSGMRFRLQDHVLSALEDALGLLAKDSPQVFDPHLGAMWKSDLETIQFLLIRALTAGGKPYSDQLVEYLCEETARFEIAYRDDYERVAVEAVRAATRYCSSEKLIQLEEVLLNYVPKWEWGRIGQSLDGNCRGLTQFALLEAIPVQRRSDAVWNRLREWSRKFGRAVDEPQPRRSSACTFQAVGSPIPEAAALKMTDDQWLAAIRKYNDDETRLRGDDFVGGASQLSQALQEQTKQGPERFCALALRFPDDTNPYYFNAALRGAAGSDVRTETMVRLCRRCHELPDRPCGQAIVRLVEAKADRDLPEELLDIVVWYVVEDPDPNTEHWQEVTSQGNPHYDGDPHAAGINSVRGNAAQAIGRLIYEDRSRLAYLRPTLDKMVRDPSVAVRSCAAQALAGVLRHDRDLAVELFLQLVDGDEALLGTRTVDSFIYYANTTHFPALQPLLERMMESESDKVATVAARQVCVADLGGSKEAETLAECCLSGRDPLRLAAAGVFARNITVAACETACTDALARLFKDDNQEIRSTAGGCFHNMGSAEITRHVGLIDAFLGSKAFEHEHRGLILVLENSSEILPELTCRIGERFLGLVGPEAGDVTKGAAFDVAGLSKVVLRVYGNTPDEAVRRRCLDLIDRMIPLDVYGLPYMLESCVRCST